MIITKQLLNKAIEIVGGDRQKEYGDKVENHDNIAKLWSAYLDVKIEAHDVSIMMILLKLKRQNWLVAREKWMPYLIMKVA